MPAFVAGILLCNGLRGLVGGRFSGRLRPMSILVPVLLVGALASAAMTLEAAPMAASLDVGGRPKIVKMAPNEDVPGLGAYLIGAVADLGGTPEVALKGYLGALAEDPDNLELRQRTFELALMAGNVDDAIRLAKTLPALEQTTMTWLAQMADAAHEGKIAGARKLAKEAGKVSPDLLQFRLMQAYLDFANGSRVDALVAALEKQPLPKTMTGRRDYHIARLWLKDGNMEKALAALKRARSVEPGAVSTALLLGQTLARQGQPDAGAAVYDEFRAVNPAVALLVPEGKTLLLEQPAAFASTLDEDMAATLADFGLLVWGQGAMGPARQVLNLSLWLNPNDVYTRYYSGLLLEMGGDSNGAALSYATLDKAGVPEGVRIAAKVRLAEVQFRQGDAETPWLTLRKLAQEHPEIANLQRSVAQLAFARKDYQQAQASYSALLASLPEQTSSEARAELYFARGAAYERDGKVKEATDDLQAALKLVPANPQVMNYLGYMWVDKGVNIPEAFEMLQKAHLLAPQDGAITDSLGWAYYRQGDYATAMTYLVMATEQDPESPEIYDHLGDAFAKLGRRRDAEREWQRALDLVAAGKNVPGEDFVKAVKKKLR